MKKSGDRHERRKKKKIASDAAPVKVYFSPEGEMRKAHVFVGLAFRGAVAFCGIFGLMHFLFMAVGLYTTASDYRFFSLSAFYMAAISLLFAALTAVASYSKKCAVIVPAATAAATFTLAALRGKPLTLVENSVRYLYNGVVRGMSSSGYTGFLYYLASEEYSFKEEVLLKWTVILFAAVFSVLFYFALVKRSSVTLFAITLAPIVVSVFMFNVSKGNLGFAFIVACISGFIAIKLVDTRYSGALDRRAEKKAERRRTRESRREERNRRKIAHLRAKSAADSVYEAALDAEMGARRARLARRAVIVNNDRLEKEEERARRIAERNERREAIERSREERRREKAAGMTEQRIEETKRQRRNRAVSGFAGFAAASLSLLAMAIPFAVAGKNFPKIAFIDNGIKEIRSYVTDALLGDEVDLTKYHYGEYERFGYETLSFDERTFDGVQIFRVEAPDKDPLFIKSRTALDYDNDNNTWSFADDDTVVAYSKRFERGFTPDVITEKAFSYLYPLSSARPDKNMTISFKKYGFSVENVHLIRVNGSGGIVFVPNVMNPSIGIMDYSSNAETENRYSSFYDGIYTSRHFAAMENELDFDKGYSTVSYIYSHNAYDMSSVFDTESRMIELTYSLAKDGGGVEEYKSEAESYPFYNDLGERYFENMTEEERKGFIESVELEHKYRDYVEETYCTKSGSAKLASLANEITGTDATRYDKVMSVINYLCGDDFTYSLSPAVPANETEEEDAEREDRSVLETFLFDTKCGYCSHYATAAAVLLREAGIPARYAEGYRVNGSSWHSSGGYGTVDKYRAEIWDDCSHTWVEVYFDSIGWVPFEVTKTFTEGVYEVTEVDVPGTETGETDAPPAVVPSTSDDEAEETTVPDQVSGRVQIDFVFLWNEYRGYFIALIVFILFLIAVRLVIFLISKRADAIVIKRKKRIEAIKDENHYNDPATDVRTDTNYLIDTLFEIFRAVDIGPDFGELPAEFGERLAAEYGGLSSEDAREAVRCIMKEEYGHGLDYGELSTLATYVEDIIRTVYAGLGRREKIMLRYIKHII